MPLDFHTVRTSSHIQHLEVSFISCHHFTQMVNHAKDTKKAWEAMLEVAMKVPRQRSRHE